MSVRAHCLSTPLRNHHRVSEARCSRRARQRTGQTGQGIATAAVRLIARFGFEDLGLLRLLELLIAADNLASRRVAEKVGATFEGVVPAGPHVIVVCSRAHHQ